MVLIDFNQLALTAIMVHLNKPGMVFDLNITRNLILSMLGTHIRMHKTAGEVIICCDANSYWRRDAFPHYKAGRKKDRAESKYDWDAIHRYLNTVKEELKENFICRVMEVDNAEADDIIAVITRHESRVIFDHKIPDIVILSADKDFLQLQKYSNVTQYSPILKQYISVDNPELFLKKQILTGDRVDGIPNFLSPADSFVTGTRQKSLTKIKIEEALNLPMNTFCDTAAQALRYQENRNLIDFKYVPLEVSNRILEEYYEQTKIPSTKKEFIKYLMSNGLLDIIQRVDDF
jgi:5'-3' exonuclease